MKDSPLVIARDRATVMMPGIGERNGEASPKRPIGSHSWAPLASFVAFRNLSKNPPSVLTPKGSCSRGRRSN
eukprot:1411201-Heterocapsa_arctica.AAC.1